MLVHDPRGAPTLPLRRITKQALSRRHGVSNAWIARILAGQEVTEPFPLAILAYPLLATFLLTGGRESEVTRLELDDVSLDRKTVTFRPNTWRRLKTPGCHRVVRLLAATRGDPGPVSPLAPYDARGPAAISLAMVGP
jgi:integrase